MSLFCFVFHPMYVFSCALVQTCFGFWRGINFSSSSSNGKMLKHVFAGLIIKNMACLTLVREPTFHIVFDNNDKTTVWILFLCYIFLSFGRLKIPFGYFLPLNSIESISKLHAWERGQTIWNLKNCRRQFSLAHLNQVSIEIQAGQPIPGYFFGNGNCHYKT